MVQKKIIAKVGQVLFLDAQKIRFRSLDDWFHSAQGHEIGNFFAAELDHLKELLYGDSLLLLGGQPAWVQSLHYNHKWCVSPYTRASSSLLSAFNQLPLDRHTLDCVVAPLVLEAFQKQKNPIDEIDRVLKPTGYVIFFGINPLSLWGLFIRFSKLSCYGHLAAKPISVLSLQRAMSHRGYIQCHLSTFYYIPPVATEKWLGRMQILNELGKMISPCPVGFYCLVMQKQQEVHPDFILQVREEAWNSNQPLQPACQWQVKRLSPREAQYESFLYEKD